jgi:hypothetical protein
MWHTPEGTAMQNNRDNLSENLEQRKQQPDL